MIGVECGCCGEEAFQLVPREVTHVVGVCLRCARRVDAGLEEQTIQEALKVMEKSERKQRFKELSYEWANNLHGKAVIVYWDDNTALACTTYFEKQVSGIAYRTTNASGGWGQVKVIISPSEHYRIVPACGYTLYCETVRSDMFYASGPLRCSGIKCEYQKPVIDGRRFGLALNTENGNYYTTVSWGCRQVLVVDEGEEISE